MGKKKVLKQTAEDLLKEAEKSGEVKSETRISGKKSDKGMVYIHSTYNNTIVSVTDERGRVLAWSSAGSLGFKGPKKATPFAASKVAELLVTKIEPVGIKELSIFINGIGGGREAPIRVFANKFNISTIKDITSVPHNGCRPKKVRRV